MWSPWRMAYVSAEHGDEYEGPACVFCDLPARSDDAATYILHRGERTFVIMNLYPYNNGHLMIVPYAHVDTLAALDEPTLTEMMMLAQRSQAVLEERMRPQGFNIGHQPGPGGRRRHRRPPAHAPAAALGRRHQLHARARETCA